MFECISVLVKRRKEKYSEIRKLNFFIFTHYTQTPRHFFYGSTLAGDGGQISTLSIPVRLITAWTPTIGVPFPDALTLLIDHFEAPKVLVQVLRPGLHCLCQPLQRVLPRSDPRPVFRRVESKSLFHADDRKRMGLRSAVVVVEIGSLSVRLQACRGAFTGFELAVRFPGPAHEEEDEADAENKSNDQDRSLIHTHPCITDLPGQVNGFDGAGSSRALPASSMMKILVVATGS